MVSAEEEDIKGSEQGKAGAVAVIEGAVEFDTAKSNFRSCFNCSHNPQEFQDLANL